MTKLNQTEESPNLDTDKEALKNRRIRSFVLRQGRVTKGQAHALEIGLPKFGISYAPEIIDLNVKFNRTESKKILEIGFGMGETTAKIAQTLPECDFLAAEVHTPGVGALLKLIEELALTNIRIIQHDVVDVLQNMLKDASLDGVHIFFPDPWHKARHHKRRLIQAGFVKLLCTKLKVGGYLHVATDWQEYAEWVLEVLNAEPQLQNTAESYAEKPGYRPLTKFENRGLKLGHGVWDMVFRRK
ncbi:tRNA (guanosine(46)-N7)-methyltransferase TrmB [Methylotenera sp.]|uniref:tRNA (guanosine(46)-N7)-methyltransferase TrmB n=1 Tax=Methylotenera sp. TaxID=2051956 RepID=UPI00272052FC|nr:tRNA (guanosine(46)-N7)-methyltransferase TrmB [Methylotenera sp.]MDO9204882.1 tRNA (guanosine(46)-N7)-methyltransferase TrmB [Methylotenera sp.]MDP1523779.1 tRNA (guanosine(46)-N7)-methyltransferase TrmB [Methylotenera sp.]MDP2231948.1 tRNA (guanosine(46)-N7)-methyltransferase TrmB [Methylotenera sp.]MDP3141047.1 tRNA (guanosine(46)-N7)-methyltransferase TrmB [Methylotenera sp.]MDP3309089.1 tRNA (guanosine(46)-N7)-methyltransferase TrmB [Methylotenera sp.]